LKKNQKKNFITVRVAVKEFLKKIYSEKKNKVVIDVNVVMDWLE
jgi:hypothetical protein